MGKKIDGKMLRYFGKDAKTALERYNAHLASTSKKPLVKSIPKDVHPGKPYKDYPIYGCRRPGRTGGGAGALLQLLANCLSDTDPHYVLDPPYLPGFGQK